MTGYQSIFKDDLFAGQNIVVTGGGSGIGRCIAHELASLGAMVIVTGRKQEKLDAVAAEIIQDGGRAQTQTFDIRDEDVVRANVAEILSRVGVINGLVNNAGGVCGQVGRPIEEISALDWQRIFDVNLSGTFFMSQAAAVSMKRQKSGRIVNISSGAGRSISLTGIQA